MQLLLEHGGEQSICLVQVRVVDPEKKPGLHVSVNEVSQKPLEVLEHPSSQSGLAQLPSEGSVVTQEDEVAAEASRSASRRTAPHARHLFIARAYCRQRTRSTEKCRSR